MSALDQPRIEGTPADHVARRDELDKGWAKLTALAGALLDLSGLPMRFRVVETPQERMKLLRVWDARMGGNKSETIACTRLPEGWKYWAFPHGPVIADASEITKADQALSAAEAVAEHVKQLP